MDSRRSFLQKSAILTGAVLLDATTNNSFAYFKNKVSPSDQLNVGAIGINGMGWANVNGALKEIGRAHV